jgi:transcriptional regulator with XRE-family HTH domain
MGQYKVPTKGTHAKFLRDKLGLSINALALKAGVYPRVVSSIEAGQGAKPHELGLVAEALGTTYDDLVEEGAPQSARPTPRKTVEATATLRLSGLSKKAVAALILDIEETLNAKYRIEVTDIRFSSVIVTCNIDRSDLWRLINAFGDGELNAFELESVALSTYHLVMFMLPALAMVSIAMWWFPLAGAGTLAAALAALRYQLPSTLKVDVTFSRIVISKRPPFDPDDEARKGPSEPRVTSKDHQSASSQRRLVHR